MSRIWRHFGAKSRILRHSENRERGNRAPELSFFSAWMSRGPVSKGGDLFLRVVHGRIQHTFGGRLNHNPHLHIMVSAGGLKTGEACWVRSIEFDREEIMKLWRFAVISYLWKAHRDGLLCASSLPEEFDDLILEQVARRWNIHITAQMSKKHFLGYAGRYIRRLPISQKRKLEVTDEEVVYQSKDTRNRTLLESRCTLSEFVATLSQHVLDRYQHSMRYFGFLASRTKRQSSAAVFALLGLQPRPKPPRQRWAASLIKHFGVDPLIDEFGHRLKWVRSRRPVQMC
jgi:hypothetical protein